MSNNEISVLVGLAILVFIVISKNARTRKSVLPKIGSINIEEFQKNIKDWFPDWTKFLYSISVIAGFNLMFMFMTKNNPGLWNSYYEKDSPFFWTLNIALVLFAFLMSKKDKDNKPVPEARTKAKLVLWALIIFSIVNFSGRFGGSSKTTNQSTQTAYATNSPVTYSSKTKLPLPPSCIADKESGDGTPGSARQFMRDGVTPVRNPLNLLATGKWQINLADPAVLALIKKEKLDVEYSEEDNDAAASLLYAEKPGGNLDPWKATMSCVGSSSIELVLEAPTDRFGEGRNMVPNRPTDIYGDGKKYTLRFNKSVEEDWPLPSGVTSKAPAQVTFLEAKSRENHPVSIKVVLR